MMPARTALARPPAAFRLDRLPISGFHRDMVKLLAYIFFFELGDLNSFAFAAPGIRAEWQLSLSAIGTITSAAFVGMFVGATTGGWFSDRVGRKRALVVTTVWYSAFSLMNAFAWNVPSLRPQVFVTSMSRKTYSCAILQPSSGSTITSPRVPSTIRSVPGLIRPAISWTPTT